MRKFYIKSQPGKTVLLDILAESEESYKIRITRITDGDKKIQEEHIERQLFDTCLATGYVSVLDNPEMICAAA
jgi:hypothetical protein